MKAVEHRSVAASLIAASIGHACAPTELVVVVRLSGLVLGEHAESKLMEAALSPAVLDFRGCTLAVADDDLRALRVATGGGASVALVGTEAQVEVLRRTAWLLGQSGCLAAAFSDEGAALDWLTRRGGGVWS